MNESDVRRGATNASFNGDSANIISAEFAVISIVAGAYYKSWYVFGGCLLALLAAVLVPYLRTLLAVVLSVAWGGIGLRDR